MATIDEKIKVLEDKLKQEKAKKQKLEARKRAVESKAKRVSENRMKILVGAFVIEQQRKGGIATHMMTYEGQRLEDWLTRSDERALFGLSPLAETPVAKG